MVQNQEVVAIFRKVKTSILIIVKYTNEILIRYKLDTYFPVFLWTIDCEKRKVAPFWELLELISKSNVNKLIDVNTVVPTEAVDKLPCLYCGKVFKEKGLEKHFKKCKDSPKLI